MNPSEDDFQNFHSSPAKYLPLAVVMGGCVASLAYMLGHWDRHNEDLSRRQLEARIERRLNTLDSEVDELDRVVRNVERAILTTDLVKIQYLETKVEKLESKLKALEESEKENVEE